MAHVRRLRRGWDDRPEGRYGKFEITVAGADRYRIALTGPELTLTQGLFGDVAWGVANNAVQTFSALADLARMRRIAMRYRPVKSSRPIFALWGSSESTTATRMFCRGNSTRSPRGGRTSTWSRVCCGVRSPRTDTLLVPLEEQVDYDDYRDVGGVQMPFRVRISDGAPYSTTTRTILEIRRNVPVADTLFRPPPTSR